MFCLLVEVALIPIDAVEPGSLCMLSRIRGIVLHTVLTGEAAESSLV